MQWKDHQYSTLKSRSLLGPVIRESPPTNAILSVNFRDNIDRGDKNISRLQILIHAG